MTFVWLKDSRKNGTLVQKVCESSHVGWIEQVDLEEEFIANIVAVEGDSFHRRYMRYEGPVCGIVRISSVGQGEGMIDGEGQGLDVVADWIMVLAGGYTFLVWRCP